MHLQNVGNGCICACVDNVHICVIQCNLNTILECTVKVFAGGRQEGPPFFFKLSAEK